MRPMPTSRPLGFSATVPYARVTRRRGATRRRRDTPRATAAIWTPQQLPKLDTPQSKVRRMRSTWRTTSSSGAYAEYELPVKEILRTRRAVA